MNVSLDLRVTCIVVTGSVRGAWRRGRDPHTRVMSWALFDLGLRLPEGCTQVTFPKRVDGSVFHLLLIPSAVPPAGGPCSRLLLLTVPCLFLELGVSSCPLRETHPSNLACALRGSL